MSGRRGGGSGWAVLAVYVAWWDLTQPETLSAAFLRWVRQHPAQAMATWAYLTAHLFALIPARLDPLRLLARRLRT